MATKPKPKKSRDEMTANERSLSNQMSSLYSAAGGIRELVLEWPPDRGHLQREAAAVREVADELDRLVETIPFTPLDALCHRLKEFRANPKFAGGVIAFDPGSYGGAEWFENADDVPDGMAAMPVKGSSLDCDGRDRPYERWLLSFDVTRAVRAYQERAV
jgi:hypothetical protein